MKKKSTFLKREEVIGLLTQVFGHKDCKNVRLEWKKKMDGIIIERYLLS